MLRRYLVAFVAVCLAFAAGIALGNGPLQGSTPTVHASDSLSNVRARYDDQLHTLRQDQAFSQAISGAAGATLLHNRLKGSSVAVFVLPGVSAATVTGVTKAVSAAGGQLVISGHLGPALIDPAKKTYVDSVATNSIHGIKDLKSAATLATYPRIGALIARAYTGGADGLAADDEATKIDAQLEGAKLVQLRDPLQRRADAVIVLAPGDHGPTDAVYARHQIEGQIVDAMAGSADALLLATPAGGSLPGGLLTTLDGASMHNAVATLNVVDTPAGQTAAVAALAAALGGHPAAYGMDGAQPVLPPGLG